MRHILFNNTNTVDNKGTTYSNPGDVPSEQIAIFDVRPDGNKENLDLTGNNATSRMQFVQGNDDGKPFISPIIDLDDVEKVQSEDYSAPVAQVTTVGYNGSTGTIENGEGTYLLKVIDVTPGYQPYQVLQVEYKADSDDTEYDIARGLFEQAVENDQFNITFEVLVDEATTQLQDASGTPSNITLDVTNGSEVVIANVASGTDVDASAGDYLRIGHATDVNNPVYEIDSIESNDGSETELEITLKEPYQGDDATGVAAGSTSTDPSDGDAAGVEITGATPHPDNDQGVHQGTINPSSFRTALSEDFGDTEIHATETPEVGTGTYAQVKEIEKNSQGGQSFYYRATAFQAEKPEFFADRDTDYDLVKVLVRTNTTPNIAKSNKYVEYVFAYDTGANVGTQLETFFGV